MQQQPQHTQLYSHTETARTKLLHHQQQEQQWVHAPSTSAALLAVPLGLPNDPAGPLLLLLLGVGTQSKHGPSIRRGKQALPWLLLLLLLWRLPEAASSKGWCTSRLLLL
jgi:hypothetical protein